MRAILANTSQKTVLKNKSTFKLKILGHLHLLFMCISLSLACDDQNDQNQDQGINSAEDAELSGIPNQGGEMNGGESQAGEMNAGESQAGTKTPYQSDLIRGEALYQQFCGFCHGDEGQGYLADNANALSNQDFLAVASDEFLELSTIHGRPGTPMSPWGDEKGGPLDSFMVKDIVAFIRTWQVESSLLPEPPSLEGNPQRGRPLYNAACSSCHGQEGEGVSAVSLNNPWFLNTVNDGFIAHAIRVGRRGTSMGAYVAPLVTEQGLADLVALIRSWSRPVDTEPLPPFTPQVDQTPLNPNGTDPNFMLREARFAPAQQVFDALQNEQKLTIIDARPAADYIDEHIKGAISLPFYEIENYANQLDPNVFTITYCGCPHAVSGQAADALIALGFPKVAILDEGFYEWRDRFGFPTVSGEQPQGPVENEQE